MHVLIYIIICTCTHLFLIIRGGCETRRLDKTKKKKRLTKGLDAAEPTSSTRNPKSGIWNPESCIWNLASRIWSQGSGIRSFDGIREL